MLARWVDSRRYQTLLGVLEEGGVNFRVIPKAVRDACEKYRELLREKKYFDFSGMIRRRRSGNCGRIPSFGYKFEKLYVTLSLMSTKT